jgi:hypothetical protein
MVSPSAGVAQALTKESCTWGYLGFDSPHPPLTFSHPRFIRLLYYHNHGSGSLKYKSLWTTKQNVQVGFCMARCDTGPSASVQRAKKEVWPTNRAHKDASIARRREVDNVIPLGLSKIHFKHIKKSSKNVSRTSPHPMCSQSRFKKKRLFVARPWDMKKMNPICAG